MNNDSRNEAMPPPLPGNYASLPSQPAEKKSSSFLNGCGLAFLFIGGMLLLLVAAIFLLGKGCVSSFQTLLEKGPAFNSSLALSEDRIGKKIIQAAAFGETRQIAVIDIKGIIVYEANFNNASAQRIAAELRAAREDDNVVAILLDMDTPGGEVVASDDLLHQVQACRAKGKPVITCMRSLAASGGYFIASGSDWIVANRMTLTGSIGVIISSYKIQGLLQKIGVEPEVYRSGVMKDMLSPTRERTEQEKAYIQSMVQMTFKEFCQVVAAGRVAFQTPDDVAASPFGDGRVLSGSDALQLGLIDQLGYFEYAVAKAKELTQAPGAAIVRFSLAPSFLDYVLSMKAPGALKLEGLLTPHSFSPEPGKTYFLAPEFCF